MKWILGFLLLSFPLGEARCQVHAFHGVVLDGKTVTLLKDVRICYGNDTAVVGRTDANGIFRVNVPPAGTSLSLALPGYKTIRKTTEPYRYFGAFFLDPGGSNSTLPPTDTLSAHFAASPPGRDISVSVKAHLNETYEQVSENIFHAPGQFPLSSFVLNANEASFCNVRRFINSGVYPPHEAVRVEEMVNYFPYQYPGDTSSFPLSIHSDVAVCPWNPDHWLMRLAAVAKPLPAERKVPSNLVLLIDISGSMDQANKLPLLKKAFGALVGRLDSSDRMAIVIYAEKVSVALPPTPGDKKHKILEVINNLNAGGATAGGAGIESAFELARNNFIPEGNNRIILATDGDFNVGVSSDEEMRKLVLRYHDWGIFLTCIGVGMGNYKDSKLETLARWGQGNFVYLDNKEEALRVFGPEKYRQILFPEVRNAAFKVIFNPWQVKKYRLIGYENRLEAGEDSLAREIPGSEIGFGQRITAFYEIEPAVSPPDRHHSALKQDDAGASAPLATVALRYSAVKDGQTYFLTQDAGGPVVSFERADAGFRFGAAVALYGMIMRQSAFTAAGDYEMIDHIIRRIKDRFYRDSRKSFLKLIQKTGQLR